MFDKPTFRNGFQISLDFSYAKSGRDYSPPHDRLCVNQIMVYDFQRPVPDVVYPLYPQHLILGLELFGDAMVKAFKKRLKD